MTEGWYYREGALVRFTWHDGQPFIGRVIEDDPGMGRVKLRIHTAAAAKPQAYSMVTCWIPYERITGELS